MEFCFEWPLPQVTNQLRMLQFFELISFDSSEHAWTLSPEGCEFVGEIAHLNTGRST